MVKSATPFEEGIAFFGCHVPRGQENFLHFAERVLAVTATDLQRSAWHRKAKPLVGEDTMLVDRAVVPGQALEDQEDLHRLRQAITTLRQEEKEVFLLRQNGELTYEQIAETYNRPVGTVKTQMRSALQKLRKIMA
jgi:RNA polymerase sigma-70 factor (ECF subfamily)